jgi:ribosomal protein L3 glutamine methyltransferase
MGEPARRLPETSLRRLRTAGDWLRFGARLLGKSGAAHGQGFLDAGEESATLLAHALGLPWEALEEALPRPMPEPAAARLRDLLERRALDREPTAYLTGEAWFGGLRFRVDPRVLIPRSYLVECLPELAARLGADKVRRAADACTGSGCLAVLVARTFPSAQVDATDLSSEALEVARLNVADHGLESRVRLEVADGLGELKGPYDLLVSNPPYEPEALRTGLPDEFRKEPAMALFAGEDGMDVVRTLLAQAAERLAPRGLIAMEVGGLRGAIEVAYPALRLEWMPTADGSDCVLLATREALRRGLTKPSARPASRGATGRARGGRGKGRAR